MNPPQQMLLNLKPEQLPTLQNFVAGASAELVARLRILASTRDTDAIYLWGPPGCGKTHLLTATASAAQRHRATARPVQSLHGSDVPADLCPPPGALLVVDDVQDLTPDAQVTLFRNFNSARFLGLGLLLSGNQPPIRLDLREDLRTRIGQTLIYEVQPLSDDEKQAALMRHAVERGMQMDAGIVQYLLRHGRRDLPSLMTMLDRLDSASLEQKRPPTLPLLRELMQTTPDLNQS